MEMVWSGSRRQLFTYSVVFLPQICASSGVRVVLLRYNSSLKEIVFVYGLSIHGPRGGKKPTGVGVLPRRQSPNTNRQTCRRPHTCAHICTQSCLAWKPIDAGPNINYLFFSRGLVTVIRVRGFFGEWCTHGLMRKTGLSIELSRHTWSAPWLCKYMSVYARVCGCDCCSSRLAAGRDTLWMWGLEADVRVETLPKRKKKVFRVIAVLITSHCDD